MTMTVTGIYEAKLNRQLEKVVGSFGNFADI